MGCLSATLLLSTAKTFLDAVELLLFFVCLVLLLLFLSWAFVHVERRWRGLSFLYFFFSSAARAKKSSWCMRIGQEVDRLNNEECLLPSFALWS